MACPNKQKGEHMVTVKSPKYPNLHVVDLGVRFVAGEAKVSRKVADALAARTSLGLIVPKPAARKPKPEAKE